MCRPRALKPYRAGLVSKKPVAGLQFLSFKLRNRFCEKCIYENYFQKINSYTASPPLLLCERTHPLPELEQKKGQRENQNPKAGFTYI